MVFLLMVLIMLMDVSVYAQNGIVKSKDENRESHLNTGSFHFQVRLEANEKDTSSTNKLILDEFVMHNHNHNGEKIPVMKEILLDETDFLEAKLLKSDPPGKVPNDFRFVYLALNKKGKQRCKRIANLNLSDRNYLVFFFNNKIISRCNYSPSDPIYDGHVIFSTNLTRAKPIIKYINNREQKKTI